MCMGKGCERAQECYRHTATPSEYRQSYFGRSPFKEDGSCDYFWPEEQERLGDRPNEDHRT